jgi:ribosomal protein L11 methyltransferase
VAEENVARNLVGERIVVRRGSLPSNAPTAWASGPLVAEGALCLLEQGQFDLVVVNILAAVIIGMTPALAARLAPTGRLIAAGIIEDQEPAVRRAWQAHSLRVIARAQEQDWVCLVAERG